MNHKLVPLSHKLNSGDQIDILTSKKQQPKEDWLNYVVTSHARQKIRHALRDEERRIAKVGKDAFDKWVKKIGAHNTEENQEIFFKKFKFGSSQELFYNIAVNNLDLDKVDGYSLKQGRFAWPKGPDPKTSPKTAVSETFVSKSKKDTLLIGENMQKIDYTLAQCCNPIPGDEVFGFITVSGGIKIHRMNCSNATNMLSKYAYRMMKARWSSMAAQQFEVKLRFTGIDDLGLVNQITQVISEDMEVNMRAISLETSDGIFQGTVTVLIMNKSHLEDLITNLKNVSAVHTVERVKEEL